MWRREWETRAWAHEREPREDDITLQSKTCVTQTWDVSNGPGVINPTNCICTNGDGSYPVACFGLHVSSYYANVSCKICDSKIILCLFVCLFIAPICVFLLFEAAGVYLEAALTTTLSRRRLMMIRPSISTTFMIFTRRSLLIIGAGDFTCA